MASSFTSGSLQGGMDWMAGLDTKKRFTIPHTYLKCMWDGKPFLQVPLDGRTAVRRLVSVRLSQDTSSGLVLRSSSWSLLTRSCLDTHVTEVTNSTDPRKALWSPPQRWQEFPRQSLTEEEGDYVISHHAAKKTCHMRTISSSVMEKPR